MKQRPWKTLSLLGLLAVSSRGQAWTAVAIPSATPQCDDPCPVHLEYLPVASLQPVPTDLADPEVFAQQADIGLQGRLEALVDTPVLQRAIREKRFAAALVDVTDLQQPRLATINGDVMVYAASLPKIAILFGLFEKAEREGLTLDAATLNSATRMIRNSSNPAATEIYYRVGPQQLADYLQDEAYRLYDVDFGGGLWVGKPYAKRDTWKRDPISNLSHGATAFQVARFLYLLERGELVSPAASAQMKEIMGKPAIRHKFVKGLGDARPGSEIYRKSGTWRTYHADAGIIERDGRRYIAVMLANDPAGSAWLSELIVGFDDLIHS